MKNQPERRKGKEGGGGRIVHKSTEWRNREQY